MARRLLFPGAMESGVNISNRPESVPSVVVIGQDVSMMRQEALDQLVAAASLPGCVRAAAMPDLHPGRGIPVGACFAVSGRVYPHLVGGDAGCGARVVCTRVDGISLDRLERHLRREFSEPSPPFAEEEAARVFDVVWSLGPRGFLEVGGVPDLLLELARAEPLEDGLPVSAAPSSADGSAASFLGTIGGGNHFAEVSLVESVTDPEMAHQLGISKGTVACLAHSGSRAVGQRLAARWSNGQPLTAGDLDRYVAELAGACRFARANRLVLVYRLLRALGVTSASEVSGGFDLTHNDVRAETCEGAPVWVHRKGAAPAHAGFPTVVLGSRGTPSYVMAGQGNERSLRSVAHGAGRRMSRTEASWRLRKRYRKDELSRFSAGGRVLCDDTELLYEEHPDVYKPIDRIVGALEDADMAYRVAALAPLVTVKL